MLNNNTTYHMGLEIILFILLFGKCFYDSVEYLQGSCHLISTFILLPLAFASALAITIYSKQSTCELSTLMKFDDDDDGVSLGKINFNK